MSGPFDLLGGGDAHDGLLPGGGDAGLAVVAHAAFLAAAVHRVHRHDVDLEQGLDGFPDLDLVRIGVHLEGVRAELVLQVHRLLADARTADDLVRVHALSFFAAWSSFTRASSAALVKTTLAWRSTEPAFRLRRSDTAARGMLRALR